MSTILEQFDADTIHEVLDDVDLKLATQGESGTSVNTTLKIGVFVKRYSQAPTTTILAGPKGSGKSTVMRKLALEAARTAKEDERGFVPLLLSVRDWQANDDLYRWTQRAMYRRYSISPPITQHWMKSGKAILMFDGLDEISPDHSQLTFLSQLRRWSLTPGFGKVVCSVESDQRVAVEDYLTVDRVAQLLPIDHDLVLKVISQILDQSNVDLAPSLQAGEKVYKFFREFVSDHSVSPSLVRALEGGTRSVDSRPSSSIGRDIYVRDEIDRADSLMKAGDRAAALDLYLSMAERSESPLALTATMRATLSYAADGESASARQYLDRALELLADVVEPPTSADVSSSLDPDEMAAHKLLSKSRALALHEIVIRSELSPSAATEAVKGLMKKGLVAPIEVGAKSTTFYESTVRDRVEFA